MRSALGNNAVRNASCLYATFSGGNETAVWTSSRMSKECTDLFRHFGGQDVFKLACLLLDFVFVLHFQGLREESFCEAMAADDIGRALLACRSEVDNEFSMLLRMATRVDGLMATVEHIFVRVVRGAVNPLFHQPKLLHAINRQRH